jgi:hypothetical protein
MIHRFKYVGMAVAAALALLLLAFIPLGGYSHFTSVSVGEWLCTEAQTAYAVTDGTTIAPTGTYMRLSSSGTVTASATTAISDGTYGGQVLVLENSTATTINIPDAANTQTSGATALGQYDTLTLIWNGSDWVEMAQADN